MKFGKLLFAITTATALLGALVASASARNIERSSLTSRASWTRMDFAGGFGIRECEIILEGRFHARSAAKTVGSLIGYITAGNITRCSMGGVSVNRESLPWHRRYRGFTGTLPNIASLSETITGAEFRLRDWGTGVTCNVRRETSSVIFNDAISAGSIATTSVSGSFTCGFIEGELGGITTNVVDGAGARITVRLI